MLGLSRIELKYSNLSAILIGSFKIKMEHSVGTPNYMKTHQISRYLPWKLRELRIVILGALVAFFWILDRVRLNWTILQFVLDI